MSFLVAVFIGLVAMLLLFKLALGVLGLVIGLALGVGAYFLAEAVVGKGR